ncbi:hypothetical protein MMC22_007512 [Lobaria immixta]|nr:hypothetical protein [Lobaria immixta]
MPVSITRDKRGISTLGTKAASQSRTTHSSCDVSNQSSLSSFDDHAANLSNVAGRDGHIPKNPAYPSLRNSATSHLQSTRGHSHATNLPGLSALGRHVTHQTQDDLVIQRYLVERDKYKEFLVSFQDEHGQGSQVVGSNLEDWNRRWNDITKPRNNNQSKSFASSCPESHI